ncbi:hypothetical protein V6N12_055364 [Hibiscus sabdariffa]|uniref:Sieve element occlusion C-terminal domain-containing protein n=1 Tax=Hibiscus sabdariffa TaxID=183260 RepID=A0ABR2A8J8_9ROSI
MRQEKSDMFVLVGKTLNGSQALFPQQETFEQWEGVARELGFVSAIRGHLEGVVDDHNCTRFILPGINRGIAERVVYAECGRPMEMYLLC